jgi:hypothetical protein
LVSEGVLVDDDNDDDDDDDGKGDDDGLTVSDTEAGVVVVFGGIDLVHGTVVRQRAGSVAAPVGAFAVDVVGTTSPTREVGLAAVPLPSSPLMSIAFVSSAGTEDSGVDRTVATASAGVDRTVATASAARVAAARRAHINNRTMAVLQSAYATGPERM